MIENPARYEHGSTLSGVIYIHRISDNRFTGISGQSFQIFRELCGEATLKNVVLVTNMWGKVSQKEGKDREKELKNKFFKLAIVKGAQLARHDDTVGSAHNIIRRIMKNHPTALQLQRELIDEGKGIADTAAGEVINKELNELIRRHEEKLKDTKEKLEKAMSDKDEQRRLELEVDRAKFQNDINKTKEDLANMTARFNEERKKTEEDIKRNSDEAQGWDWGRFAENTVNNAIQLASLFL